MTSWPSLLLLRRFCSTWPLRARTRRSLASWLRAFSRSCCSRSCSESSWCCSRWSCSFRFRSCSSCKKTQTCRESTAALLFRQKSRRNVCRKTLGKRPAVGEMAAQNQYASSWVEVIPLRPGAAAGRQSAAAAERPDPAAHSAWRPDEEPTAAWHKHRVHLHTTSHRQRCITQFLLFCCKV